MLRAGALLLVLGFLLLLVGGTPEQLADQPPLSRRDPTGPVCCVPWGSESTSPVPVSVTTRSPRVAPGREGTL